MRPKNKRSVYVQISFIRVGEINTMKEAFDAEVMVKSRWREPSLDGKEGDVVKLENQWNPQIYIQNAIGDPQITVTMTTEMNERKESFVVERKKFRGSFVEFMELRDFPFDVQELSIHLKSDVSLLEAQLIEDPDEMHAIHRRSFIDEQEFYLYKHVATSCPPLRIDQELRIVRETKPGLRVTIKAARRPHYYIYNICILMSILIATSFSSFGLEVQYLANRLQLTFGLVLAGVTFKNLINAHIPKISYFTYLDAYVMTMIILLVTISCFHGLLTRMKESHKASVDRVGFICFTVIYIIFHLIFIAVVLIQPYGKRRRMTTMEKEYQRKYSESLAAKKGKTSEKSETIAA